MGGAPWENDCRALLLDRSLPVCAPEPLGGRWTRLAPEGFGARWPAARKPASSRWALACPSTKGSPGWTSSRAAGCESGFLERGRVGASRSDSLEVARRKDRGGSPLPARNLRAVAARLMVELELDRLDRAAAKVQGIELAAVDFFGEAKELRAIAPVDRDAFHLPPRSIDRAKHRVLLGSVRSCRVVCPDGAAFCLKGRAETPGHRRQSFGKLLSRLPGNSPPPSSMHHHGDLAFRCLGRMCRRRHASETTFRAPP